jgi:hypothetical protein
MNSTAVSSPQAGDWLLRLTWEPGTLLRLRLVANPRDLKQGDSTDIYELIFPRIQDIKLHLTLDRFSSRIQSVKANNSPFTGSSSSIEVRFSMGVIAVQAEDVSRTVLSRAIRDSNGVV